MSISAGRASALQEKIIEAIKIAEKLDSLSDEEFLISSYPYMWRKEIDIGKTGKVVNKEAAEALTDIVIDNEFWNKED